MAYARRNRYRRPTSRFAKKPYGGSKSRRSFVKRRTFKKRRPTMTSKRILNLTATKKRDTMLTYTNVSSDAANGGTTYRTDVPAVLTGGQDVNSVRALLWCATARDNTISSANNRGTAFDQAARTSTTPYMIGLKEAIEIQVSTGMPWQWRRICFTYKGPIGLALGTSQNISTETSNGWVRLVNDITGNPGGGQQYILFEKLFKGQNTQDWNDAMTAKVDNTRVTLKYDKTCTLASGNEDGFIRKYNKWHPMRKTLVYNDDELGGGEAAQVFSTQGKAGMGDYYVLDLFRARTGSTSSDQLSFRPESTLYWHEK
ncbi:putative capsid protein [Spider associated circular virus 2]|nr:putative capsid protein [Spider associated circular virus 2]